MSAALPSDDLDLVLSLTPSFWSRFAGSRLFITGGTGFIGTWLLQVVQRANDQLNCKIEIIALSRDPSRAMQVAPRVFGRRDVRLLAGNVTDFSGTVGQLDLCIHAATDVGDPGKTTNPLQVFESIAHGTQRVLEFARSNGVSRFLLTSSGAVYGVQPPELNHVAETYLGAPDPLSPSAAYGNGKRSAEWLTCAHAAQDSLTNERRFETVIARIFALIGPGLPLNGNFAAGNFIRDALNGPAIKINGDGRPQRSYLYMADLCVWQLRLLESGSNGQAYNVGSEQPVSIRELAQQIAQAADTKYPALVMNPSNSSALPPRYVPDTSKARQALGLSEFTPLETALSKTVHWSRMAMAS